MDIRFAATVLICVPLDTGNTSADVTTKRQKRVSAFPFSDTRWGATSTPGGTIGERTSGGVLITRVTIAKPSELDTSAAHRTSIE